ncbi:MAG: response regulator [Polyangia bacterium]|jgi:PAS domain S-box-containing protein|nr:response regulator [Polyangia bacterium]
MLRNEQQLPAVSGLVCGAILSYVESHGGSAAKLAEGLGASPERLSQWHAWFPWETYLNLERRFGQAMAHQENPYVDLGKYVVAGRWLGPASLVLGTFATAAQTYSIVPWLVPRFLLSGASIEHQELSEGTVVLDYLFPEHILPTASFLEVIRGQLTMGPSFVGQPPAEVTVTRRDPRLTRFEVRLPGQERARGRDLARWVGRRVLSAGRRSRVLLDLGGELLRTNELLGQKLRELEESHERLQAEALERQRAVAAVRASEERYRALAEAAEDVIAVLDAELRIHFVNPRGAALGRSSPEELLGLSLASFLPEERCSAIRSYVAEVLRTGRTINREGSFGEGDAALTFDASFVPLREGQVGADKVLCVARDVTGRRRVERERESLYARLRESQKMESLGVLVGGVAHDFNNLLTVVRGNAELASQRLASDHPVRGLVLPIVEAARQGAALCRLMLAYAGKEASEKLPLELSATLGGMESILRAAIPSAVELRFQLSEGLPLVQGDCTQLRQLVMNMVVNGAEALGGGPGLVTVRTGVFEPSQAELASAVLLANHPSARRYVFLEVSDTGCGMDAQTRARAFDPFFTTKFPGRGLGLAAVLGTVRGHEGLLILESAPGQGTRILVGLPQVMGTDLNSSDHPRPEGVSTTDAGEGVADRVPALEEEGEPEVQSRPDFIGELRLGVERSLGPVLLVDDELEIRELGRVILEGLGLEVLTAADGEEALARFEGAAARISAAILDITMPNMDGETLFWALRERAPELPVLFVSGHSAQEVRARFEGLDKYAFLSKPYSIPDLARALGALLEEGARRRTVT